MNQRSGKTHAAAAFDNRQTVDLAALIKFVADARFALEQEGEDESALRFELFEEYLREDVANGKPFGFTYKALGL